MKNKIIKSTPDHLDPKFEALQKARRELKAAYSKLLRAHRDIQISEATAVLMTEGDVKSLCGISSR